MQLQRFVFPKSLRRKEIVVPNLTKSRFRDFKWHRFNPSLTTTHQVRLGRSGEQITEMRLHKQNSKLFHSSTIVSQAMSSISKSITQTIVPAVRRAASTAAPAATQSAKEGFKLVEVCLLFLLRNTRVKNFV